MRRVILALLAPAAIATAVTASASAAVVSPNSPIMKIGAAATNVAYAVRRTTVRGPRGAFTTAVPLLQGVEGITAAACTLAGAFTCAVADITAVFMHAGASTRAVGIMAVAFMRVEAFTPVVRAAASMGAELFTVAADSSKSLGRAWAAIKCATA